MDSALYDRASRMYQAIREHEALGSYESPIQEVIVPSLIPTLVSRLPRLDDKRRETLFNALNTVAPAWLSGLSRMTVSQYDNHLYISLKNHTRPLQWSMKKQDTAQPGIAAAHEALWDAAERMGVFMTISPDSIQITASALLCLLPDGRFAPSYTLLTGSEPADSHVIGDHLLRGIAVALHPLVS